MIAATAISQTGIIISGKITEEKNIKPMQNATIHLKGSTYSTLSKIDGSYRLHVTDWYDSLEITSLEFEPFTIALQKESTSGIAVNMKPKTNAMQEVGIDVTKKPSKCFMDKVIDLKANNNPSRFRSFSYQCYTRKKLDIHHVDYEKTKGSSLKNLMVKTYSRLDSNAKNDKELPIYFAERHVNGYHSVSSNTDRRNIISKNTWA